MATNQLDSVFDNTAITRFWHQTSSGIHIAAIIALVVVVHVAVKIIHHLSEWFIVKSHVKKSPFVFVTEQPKFVTLTRLIVSAITFTIYFLAIGFTLVEGFNFKLTTYLASASVIP